MRGGGETGWNSFMPHLCLLNSDGDWEILAH